MATDDNIVIGHRRWQIVGEVDRAEVNALKVLRHQHILRDKLWWILCIVVVPDAHLGVVTDCHELELAITSDEGVDLDSVMGIAGHVSRASHEA